MSAAREDAPAGIHAAFSLAVRMTGSRARAGALVEQAASAVGVEQKRLVWAVRRGARAAPREPDGVAVPRPDDLHEVALGDWAIVERIALRGMTVAEAASDTGLSRSEVALRLRRGMIAARDALRGRQATDHPQPAPSSSLGRDLPTCALDDAPGHRQAEPAPLSGLTA